MNRRIYVLVSLCISCGKPQPHRESGPVALSHPPPVIEVVQVEESVDPEIACATKLLNLDMKNRVCVHGNLTCEEILMTPVVTCDVE
jgi:hypothetical protein